MKLQIDHWYDQAKNIHFYHIGYIPGLEGYKEFYQWQSSRQLRYAMDDMPHDYFVYKNEEDRLELHEKWAEYIAPVEFSKFDPEGWHDFDAPVDPVTAELGQILFDEIQKEINRELLETIARNCKK